MKSGDKQPDRHAHIIRRCKEDGTLPPIPPNHVIKLLVMAPFDEVWLMGGMRHLGPEHHRR